jgi:hypothetical protein
LRKGSVGLSRDKTRDNANSGSLRMPLWVRVIHRGIRSSVCPRACKSPGGCRKDFELNRMTEAGARASSAESMTPEQRFEEVAAILARGCRRATRDLPRDQHADIRTADGSDVPFSDLSTPNAHE